MPKKQNQEALKSLCVQCQKKPRESFLGNFCFGCTKFNLENAYNALPFYPMTLDEAYSPSTTPDSVTCCICQIKYPMWAIFQDSKKRNKCVLCRKWEVLNKVEAHPSIQMHITMEGHRIKCLQCGQKFKDKDMKVDCAGSKNGIRVSMFCPGCRVLEQRFAQQGLINIEE